MPVDLISACVFCGVYLFGADAQPINGLNGNFGISQSTFGRRLEHDGGVLESSDATGKFITIGMGGARPAPGGLGAGTPAAEIRAQLAVATSHDEADARGAPPGALEATGSGRFENYALIFRAPVSAADSIELGVSRRFHRPVDVLTSPNNLYTVAEERTLSADRVDAGIGWRHRWNGWEAQGAGLAVLPKAANGTGGAFHITRGNLWGASAEVRAAWGPVTAWISGERVSGTLDSHEESQPDFQNHRFRDHSLLEGYQAGIARSWRKFSLLLSGAYERSRLPFVSEAVLGTETLAFDQGYHPLSRSKDWVGSTRAEYAVSANVRIGLFIRLGYGSEPVSLTDARGQLPPEELPVQRRAKLGKTLSYSKRFGSGEPTLALTVRFALSSPTPAL